MQRRSFIFAAFGAVLSPACASAQHAAGVPMSFDQNGRPVVDALINGRGPFPLVLDTAAQQIGVSAQLIQDAALSPSGQHAQLHGASGILQVPLYTIERIEVGNVSAERVLAAPLTRGNDSAPGHAGVLAPTIFGGVNLGFDYAERRVHIGQAIPAGVQGIELQLVHGTFVLFPIEVAGVSATAVLDTGAQHSMGNVNLRQALGFADSDPRLRRSAEAGGATGHTLEFTEARIAGVTVGDVRTSEFDLKFAAAPVFHALGLADRPSLILGADILHQWRRFDIDYANRRLFVSG